MKLVISIIIFIFTFNTIDVYGIKYHFEWENVEVEIPLNDSYTKYLYTPKASFYIDNTLISDAEIDYNVTGDWLYYSKDIDTSKVGTYKVWYKAFESKYRPGECPGYKQIISFKVVDKTPPKIKLLSKKMNVKLGSSVSDLDKLNFYTLSDNYDDIENINVTYKILDKDNVETGLLTFNSLESYRLKIIASDTSSNVSEEIIDINVVNNVGPKVKYSGSLPIVIKKGESIPYLELFEFSDDININTIRMKSNIDINKIYSGDGDFIFLDQYNNETIINLPFEIKEEILPIINLNKDIVVFQYETEINNINFLDFIDSISYRNKEYIIEDSSKLKLNIDKTKLVNKVGDYIVTYNVEIDRKKVQKELICSFTSLEAPIVSSKDVNININEQVDLKDYIDVYDKSDPNAKDTLDIDLENYDITREGIYYLNYTVKNSSGLYASGVLKVIVKKPYNFFTTKNILIISLLIVVISGGIVYYFYKKKHKTDEFLNI